MFEGVCKYFRACDNVPLAKNDCVDSMYEFLSSLEQLNTLWCGGLADDDKIRMHFHVRPKCHGCQHIVEDQLDLWGTPRNFNCFMDEHYIGGMKKTYVPSQNTHTP